MDIPLGSNIGNSLEIEEAIEVLNNRVNNELTKLCIELSSYMVSLGLNISIEEARKKVVNNLKNGKAYNKFIELINYQHGNIEKLPKTKAKYEIKAKKSGYITNLTADKIGKLAMSLGAGRANKEDTIDYSAGVILDKKNGDYVHENEVVMRLFTNKEIDTNIDIEITDIEPKKEELIYEIIV